jgi:molybdopterin converting factor subunit 1
MMTVRVRLFARARELAGTDVVTLTLPAGANVGQLRHALSLQCPGLGALLQRSALAVNEEFAQDTTPLSADSDVALLPPVSGG